MEQFTTKVQQEAQFHIYPRPRNEGDYVQEKKAAKQADETQAAVAKCHCKSKIATGKSWSTTIKQPLWQQTQQVQDEHRRWSPQFASAALVLSSWLAAVSASQWWGLRKGGSVTTAKESPSSCSQRLLSDEQIQMCSTHPPSNSKRNIQEPRKDCCAI